MKLGMFADFYIIDRNNKKFNYREICKTINKNVLTYEEFISFINKKLKEK